MSSASSREHRSSQQGGGSAATGGGRKYLCWSVLAFAPRSGRVRNRNRRYTIPRVRTRDDWDICKGLHRRSARRHEYGVRLRAGDSGAGVETGQTAGELHGVHVRECEAQGARCEDGGWIGPVSRIGGCRGYTTSVGCCEPWGTQTARAWVDEYAHPFWEWWVRAWSKRCGCKVGREYQGARHWLF